MLGTCIVGGTILLGSCIVGGARICLELVLLVELEFAWNLYCWWN